MNETVEQAAERLYPSIGQLLGPIGHQKYDNAIMRQRECFLAGANWQSQQDGWVSVEEREKLPKTGDHFSILVYGSYTRDCPQRPTEVHYYWRGKNIEFRNMDGSRTKNVTHWQPLPAKPKELNKQS